MRHRAFSPLVVHAALLVGVVTGAAAAPLHLLGVARSATYDRVHRDLTAIATMVPALAENSFRRSTRSRR